MFRRAQQQQPPRDRIAVQQQMAGSNDFQAPPQPGEATGHVKPRQLGDRHRARPLHRGAEAPATSPEAATTV